MDEDGFLYIVDRKKDLLKYQINKYLPRDIEEVISQMPGVAEVCVFGIFDQFNGDAAAAAIVKRSGYEISSQDVVDYVQGGVQAFTWWRSHCRSFKAQCKWQICKFS